MGILERQTLCTVFSQHWQTPLHHKSSLVWGMRKEGIFHLLLKTPPVEGIKTLAFWYRHLTTYHIFGAYSVPSIPRVKGTEMNETDHALTREDFEVVFFKL